MPFDFNAWVDSFSDLAPETKEAVKKLGEDEKFRTKLANDVMMRSDYSRSMDQLTADRKAVEDSKLALADLEKTYREGGSKTQAELEQYKQEGAALRKQLFDAQEKLRTEYRVTNETLADLGMDKIAEPPAATPPVQQPPAAGVDPSKFVSIEEFNNVRQAALIWPAVINQLQMEHASIFNRKDDKAFNPVEFTKKVMEVQQDPQLVYDEMYGATARRKEIEVAAIRAATRQELEAEYQAKIDAMSIDPTRIQQVDEHDFFTEAIRSAIPTDGSEIGPLIPTGNAGQAGIEQAREVKKAQLAQPGA